MIEGLVAVIGSLIVALLLDIRGDVKLLTAEHRKLMAWAQANGFRPEKWA